MKPNQNKKICGDTASPGIFSPHVIDRYYERLYNELSTVNTMVFDFPANILDIYQPLTLRSAVDSTEFKIRDIHSHLFANHAKIFIHGDRGMGKTTLLKLICVSALKERKFIPVFIDLREIKKRDGIIEKILQQLFIDADYPDVNVKNVEHFFEFVNEKNFLFAFDGTDEIDLHVKDDILQYLREFISLMKNSTVILSSSTAGDFDLFKNDLELFHIEKLTKIECIELIRRYDNLNDSKIFTQIIGNIENNKMAQNFTGNSLFVVLIYKNFLNFLNDNRVKENEEKTVNRFMYGFGKLLTDYSRQKINEKKKIFIANHKAQDHRNPGRETQPADGKGKDGLVFSKPVLIPGKNDFIIQPYYPGIGDTFFHNHLPRIAKESGHYDKVLISTKTEYRNIEIKYLAWELNPYVDGYCHSRSPYHGIEILAIEQLTKNGCKDMNLLDYIMLKCGLDDHKRFHEPELFYKPQAIPGIKNNSVYDPNYISNPRLQLYDFFKVGKYFKEKKILINYQMKFLEEKIPDTRIDHIDWVSQRSIPIDTFDLFLETETLRDLCDVLFSASAFYCLTTGTATLAAALNKSITVLVGENLAPVHHSKLHSYVNISDL